MPIGVSFFTGAGGLDIGFKNYFDVRLAVELEDLYCSTMKRNFPDFNVIQGDIMDFSREKVLAESGLGENDEVDVIFGGSPCQSFSTSGKRLAFVDVRGQAMLKFVDLVNELQPRAFLLENVKGLLSASLKHRPLNERGLDFPPLEIDEMPGSALEYLLNRFQGYDIKFQIINSADYGVPQKRERVIFVGIRNDLNRSFVFPETTHNEKGSDGKLPWVSFKEAVERENLQIHTHVNYSQDRLKYMKMIPKGGGNWRDLPQDVVKEAMGGAYTSGGGKVGFFRRIASHKPAPTMLTSPIQKSTNLGHPEEDRPLSIQEYLIVQGFPANYEVVGTINQQYVQIGNAVPVPLATILAEKIHETLLETQN